jgi:AraC-like DNA-binding protein
MAMDLGISKSYLSPYFKKEIGQTIIQYVNERKINRAKYLLDNTDKTVGDIVVEIGYIDISSFVKKFREQVGISPAKYRNRLI